MNHASFNNLNQIMERFFPQTVRELKAQRDMDDPTSIVQGALEQVFFAPQRQLASHSERKE